MKKVSVREMLQLYLYDELSADDRRSVEEMLSTSAESRTELEELKTLHRTLAHYQPVTALDRELVEARNELRIALRHERSRTSWSQKVSDFFAESVFAQYKLAFGGVAAIALGFLLGYAVFSSSTPERNSLFRQTSAGSAFDQSDTQVMNVRFANQSTDDGMVDLTFDAVTPMHVKGNANDPRITTILARALVNERNPGVRLRTVSTISDQTKIQPSTEKEVKASLISVLKYDPNPGVRKEALKALQRFPVDDDIVEAILYVLKNEKNTGMRIAAINFLDFSKLSGQPVDKDLLETLKERMQSDENNYIRIRGNAAFQEVKK
jgi:hypothetical protein